MGICAAIHKYAIMIGIGAVAFAYLLGTANAQQVADAPFTKFQERYGAEWAVELPCVYLWVPSQPAE